MKKSEVSALEDTCAGSSYVAGEDTKLTLVIVSLLSSSSASAVLTVLSVTIPANIFEGHNTVGTLNVLPPLGEKANISVSRYAAGLGPILSDVPLPPLTMGIGVFFSPLP